MILEAQEDHLFAVSDLHLGSPVSTSVPDLLGFLDHVEATGASLCINGDGFDLLQSSWSRLVAGGLPIVRRLRRLRAAGSRIYYLLGNHDIALEHMLMDLPITVGPFLNLVSGDARIRLEHGHVYDPTFMEHPDLYELGGRVGRYFLFLHRDTYRLFAVARDRVEHRRRTKTPLYPHHAAADALFARGFAAVVLGHTHRPERTELDGGLFVNGGDWVSHRSVVEINRGEITLHEWRGELLPVA